MAVINNLIVGLLSHLKWTNLAEARRYYDAHPREAQHLACSNYANFGKTLISLDKRY